MTDTDFDAGWSAGVEYGRAEGERDRTRAIVQRLRDRAKLWLRGYPSRKLLEGMADDIEAEFGLPAAPEREDGS